MMKSREAIGANDLSESDDLAVEVLAAVDLRVRDGLVAAYGPEVGIDCHADAMAWAWEHREELVSLTNPAGYLYRVGQSSARAYRKPQGFLPLPDRGRIPSIEPGLVPALERLTESQRVAVAAVHAFGWSQQEVADLLEVSHSTVRTHIARGLKALKATMEATK